MPAKWILAPSIFLLLAGFAAPQDGGFTPDWTVGDWWEVEYHDVEPFCPAAHVCPPDGHPRVRMFLFLVMDQDEKEIEVKIVGGRDLAATAYLLATFRASDRSLARLRAVGWGEFDRLFLPGRPLPDPMAGASSEADFPALLFVSPVFPLVQPPPPPDDAELARLVETLGSDSWEKREEAAKALEGFGAGMADSLARYLEHEDAEVRYRVARLLDRLSPDAGNESYQKVEKTPEGAYRVELASGRKLVWRPDEPWYESLELDLAQVPGDFPGGGGRPFPSVRLVAKKGDPGVEPLAIEDAHAAQIYGELARLSLLDLHAALIRAQEFVTKFPDSPYAVKVVLRFVDCVHFSEDLNPLIELFEGRRRAGIGTPGELAAVEKSLGLWLYERKDRDGAIEAFRRALTWLDRHPDDEDVRAVARSALDGLATLEWEQDPAAALGHLSRLVEIGSPENRVESWSGQAAIHASAGRHAQTEAALRQALAECIPEGDTEDLRFRLGEALAAQGKDEEAREIWRSIRAVESDWTAKAREKLAGTPVVPGFRVIESHYSQVDRSRTNVTGAVRRISSEETRILVDREGCARAEWTAERGIVPYTREGAVPLRIHGLFGFESPLVVGDYEIRAPERFNRGAALLADLPADLDGDGAPERILTVLLAGWVEEKGHPEFYGGEVHVLGADGKLLWKVEIDEPAEGALASDVDGDGKSEIVVGTRSDDGKGAVTAISAEGQKLWRRTTDRGVRSVHAVPAADGHPRLVVMTDSAVLALDRSGAEVWSDDVAEPVAAVADLNGDGREEIALGGDRTWLEVRDADGKVLHRVEGFTKIRALFPVPGPDGTRRLLVGAAGLHVVGYEK
ncbi:MAG: PQQ-binding-like beta-propeller repeat protein [Planctomycetes bacterium]|nr:PQQ-binding-like beta-propeller repeat protein [Planctomycetota bacterium]